MRLNEDQQAVLFAIGSDPALSAPLELVTSAFEAELARVQDDPERTDPRGFAVSGDGREPVGLDEAATVVAIAWIETLRRAAELGDGELDPVALDGDGVPIFVDASPLFRVAKACGFSEGQLRRTLSAKLTTSIARRHAMRILHALGALRPGKRRVRLRGRPRVVRLAPAFARSLDEGEIARAKAGSVFYSLVVRKDGYEAERSRRTSSQDEDGSRLPLVATDAIEAFSVPLMPCPEADEEALRYFVAFLAEQGLTYQRLVHR